MTPAAFDVPSTQRLPTIAVLGLGYVGLPTALSARSRGAKTLGIDLSDGRLKAIREARVDLVAADRALLRTHLADEDFVLTNAVSMLADADAVLICVPTPVDEHRDPEMSMIQAACADVVRYARRGQTIILTSTSYPGTTRDLLAAPLADRGFEIGTDIFVASSPERIDPGNPMPHADVPRIVGGMTPACTERAADVLRRVSDRVVPVSSAIAAEMTKLLENSFRAVNIAFANEMAEVCQTLGIDPREVIDAAATKPYGFMAFYPGTGVGGHCIPCDPHYLLWELRSRHTAAPILAQAMEAIAARPLVVVDHVAARLSSDGKGLGGSRVLVAGVAYKPGVEDVRESPAIAIINELRQRGAEVDFYDPLVPSLRLDDHSVMLSVKSPDPAAYDACVVHVLHPSIDHAWLQEIRIIVDPAGILNPTRQPRAESRMVAEFGDVAFAIEE